jgi:Ca-activated chloride channel homolog
VRGWFPFVATVSARIFGVACMAASLVPVALAAAGMPQAPVFRVGVDLVNLGVTVIEKKGALLADLEAADFEVYEDGKPQTIRVFAAGDSARNQPGPDLHLGLLLDVSESMGEDIKFTRTAAVKFLNTLVDAVDVTVVDFDSEVRVARYGQSDFARLIERIRRQKTTGMTALYDAIGVYLDGAGGQTGRKIMLIYSDGDDTRSAMRWSELQDLLKASDVTVYAIGSSDHQSSFVRERGRSVLRSIAELTGGAAFFPSTVKELDQIYEKVLAEIRAQYTIGYLSTNDKADGAWRKVEVRIVPKNRKDAQVRSRRGYFAPYKAPPKP